MGRRWIIYARVARANPSLLAKQIDLCRARISEFDKDPASITVIRDVGSRHPSQRPGFKVLVQAIEDGEADAIAVEDIRRLIDRAYLLGRWPSHVLLLTASVEPSAVDSLMVRVMAALAESESVGRRRRSVGPHLNRPR